MFPKLTQLWFACFFWWYLIKPTKLLNRNAFNILNFKFFVCITCFFNLPSVLSFLFDILLSWASPTLFSFFDSLLLVNESICKLLSVIFGTLRFINYSCCARLPLPDHVVNSYTDGLVSTDGQYSEPSALTSRPISFLPVSCANHGYLPYTSLQLFLY